MRGLSAAPTGVYTPWQLSRKLSSPVTAQTILADRPASSMGAHRSGVGHHGGQFRRPEVIRRGGAGRDWTGLAKASTGGDAGETPCFAVEPSQPGRRSVAAGLGGFTGSPSPVKRHWRESAPGEMADPHAVFDAADDILRLSVAAMVGLQFQAIALPDGDAGVIAVIR